MKASALIAAGALGLMLTTTACTPAKKDEAPAKAAPAAAATPAAAPGVAPNPDGAVWSFWQTEEGSHLTFAVPESDDVTHYFVCQSGSGTLQASMWADHAVPGPEGEEAPTEMTQLTLTSGAVSKAYEAVAEGEEMYGGSQVMAMNVGLADPVIKEFARTGAIQFAAFGDKTSMPAAPLADVQKLLNACKKAS